MDASDVQGSKSADGRSKRAPIRSFRDLEVYQRGRALQAPIYRLVEGFPDFEKYDLADQMRRACKSVATDIAEGYAKRDSEREFRRFLRTSMASANEKVHLETARDLGYVSEARCTELTSEYQIIGRQLQRLIQNWRTYTAPASSIQRSASARNSGRRE